MPASRPPKYDFRFLSWNDIIAAISSNIRVLRAYNYHPRQIVGIARGGLIPATMMSHALKVPLRTINVRSYNDVHDQLDSVHVTNSTTGKLLVMDDLESLNNVHTLFVDDLWDSGNTHQALSSLFPNAVFTNLYYKDRGDRSHFIVNYPGQPLDKDKWVVFPWEL